MEMCNVTLAYFYFYSFGGNISQTIRVARVHLMLVTSRTEKILRAKLQNMLYLSIS